MSKFKCIILSGIPCSGKSTWASKQGIPILSCDKIREELFGKDYKFSPYRESLVWDYFYKALETAPCNIIVDNTNCRYAYISRISAIMGARNYEIEIKKFPISLSGAYYRNIIRYLKQGKWIPFKVIKNMNKNFNKLKYKDGEYIFYK